MKSFLDTHRREAGSWSQLFIWEGTNQGHTKFTLLQIPMLSMYYFPPLLGMSVNSYLSLFIHFFLSFFLWRGKKRALSSVILVTEFC